MSLFRKSRVRTFIKHYAWPFKKGILVIIILSTIVGIVSLSPAKLLEITQNYVLLAQKTDNVYTVYGNNDNLQNTIVEKLQLAKGSTKWYKKILLPYSSINSILIENEKREEVFGSEKLKLNKQDLLIVEGMIKSNELNIPIVEKEKKLLDNKEERFKSLYFICIAFIILGILKGLGVYLTTYLGAKLSGKMAMKIREDMYKKIHGLSFDFFSESKSGDLMSRFSIDTDRALSILLSSFTVVKDVTWVVGGLVYIFVINYKLATVSIIVLPLVVSFIKKYGKRMRATGKEIQLSYGRLNSILQEGISGMRVIKAFASEKYEIEKYKKENEDNYKFLIKNRRLDARVKPLVELLNSLAVIGVLYYGGSLVVRGKMNPGELLGFITALGMTADPMKRISDYINNLNTAIPAIDRIYEILELDSSIKNKENPVIPDKIIGEVQIEKVSFAYNEDKEVLKNLNLSVEKGKMIALVGQSGSGKSTLVNLLPRFYDVTEGSIKIDGIDIRDYDLYTLRKNIGIVPQETFLFSGSVKDNIIYGKRDASHEEVVEALKMANAYNFVMDLPNKLDTEVGERGVLLSGGQKQRLAIARAILENPPIMILDEATSALDTESERLVQDALDKLMTNRTTFVIAHRLSTILHADTIVVMDNGEIKETGSHQELLAKKGIYTKLYETQFGKLEEENNA